MLPRRPTRHRHRERKPGAALDSHAALRYLPGVTSLSSYRHSFNPPNLPFGFGDPSEFRDPRLGVVYPTREYTIGSIRLRFAHRKTQHTAIDDHFAATVVQAILAIGKDAFSDQNRLAIAAIARDRNPQRLVKDTRKVTSWVHDEILRIARLAESPE
jgi:hypothetical protein